MREIQYTLLTDGSSDQALIPVLNWLLRDNRVDCAIRSAWLDLRRLPRPPRTLPEKIKTAIDLYPCDLLFIHRDAESASIDKRKQEIDLALRQIADNLPSAVCVIPVRMQEAWLLIDEAAIRAAASNPNGSQHIALPPIATLETLPDPKSFLHTLLHTATGFRGRDRDKFNVRFAARRVSEFIDDFTPLRRLSAFKTLENDLRSVIQQNRWDI